MLRVSPSPDYYTLTISGGVRALGFTELSQVGWMFFCSASHQLLLRGLLVLRVPRPVPGVLRDEGPRGGGDHAARAGVDAAGDDAAAARHDAAAAGDVYAVEPRHDASRRFSISGARHEQDVSLRVGAYPTRRGWCTPYQPSYHISKTRYSTYTPQRGELPSAEGENHSTA